MSLGFRRERHYSKEAATTLAAMRRRERRRPSAAAALFAAAVAVAAAFLPAARAVVSYCNDQTEHSMSSAQGEALCRTAGEYGFAARTDKASGETLYGDLGEANAQRRYTAASFDDALVAKYVNYSDYALFVRVDEVQAGVWRYKCCQVCEIDCAPTRYVCPVADVPANASCAVSQTQVARCRFGEELVVVRARLLCAVKLSRDFAVPPAWWQPSGLTLRTSWRDCPYRELAVNGTYLLMATAGTPLYGGDRELVGADIVATVKRDLPAAFFRKMSLEQPGYAYLLNQTGRYCPSPTAIRKLSSLSSSSSSPPLLSPSSSLPAAHAAIAAAAAVAAVRLALLPAVSVPIAAA